MVTELGNYKKLIAGVLTGLATWLTAATAQGGISQQEWVALIVLLLGSIVLWLVPAYNTPPPPPQPFSEPPL